MTREEYIEQIQNDLMEIYGDQLKAILQAPEQDQDNLLYEIEDKAFCNDSITGNASGSYTFNAYEARSNVEDAEDVIQDLINDYCIDAKTIAEKIFNWEYWDVSIRCYL